MIFFLAYFGAAVLAGYFDVKLKFRMRKEMKFNHIGIPTIENFDGEIDLPHLKMLWNSVAKILG